MSRKLCFCCREWVYGPSECICTDRCDEESVVHGLGSLSSSPLSQRKARHPARASDDILLAMARFMSTGDRVLNPFSGTGRLAEIVGIVPVLVEIERDWATQVCADATALPFSSGSCDGAAWSPTYGNRFSDHHNPQDGSRRRSYKFDIGHDLQARNTGQMQWGSPGYWELHRQAYAEVARVVRPGGYAILNVKDHYRGRVVQPVSEWHLGVLSTCGFVLRDRVQVPVSSLRDGANRERIEFEWVFHLRKGR